MTTKPIQSNKAMSLIELLIVVTIIGILTSIAVPAMSRLIDPIGDTKAKRNAQTLAATYGAAQAAGLDFSDPSNDINVIVENLVTGDIVPGDGPLSGDFFGVPGLSEEERTDAIRFLEYDTIQNSLKYDNSDA